MTGRMPEQPDIISDYNQLVTALKARIDQLQLSQNLKRRRAKPSQVADVFHALRANEQLPGRRR